MNEPLKRPRDKSRTVTVTYDDTPGTALAISFAPDCSGDERLQLLRRARRTIALREGPNRIHESDRGDHVVLTTRRPAPARGVLTLAVRATQNDDGRIPPSACLDLDEDWVRVRTDPVALAAVYHGQGRRYAAVSTSCFVLAALHGAGLDEAAWAHLALLGFQLGTESPFHDVTRLGPGTMVELHHGRRRLVSEEPPTSVPEGPVPLRRIVTTMLDEHPEAVLELSGGLDSRTILAAIPPARRRDLVTMTIGEPDSADVVIARDIARDEGLRHIVLSDRCPSYTDPGEARRRCDAAALRYECQTNVLASAVLGDVEERAPTGPRLTGVNGEYLRGFYYPGTRRRAPVSHSTVGRLVRWRMVTNDRVTPDLFINEWWRDRRDNLVNEVTERLQARSPHLRRATDEFYLYDRVARWAGPSYTEASRHRAVLAPFLHPDILATGQAIDPRMRAGSKALARLLEHLDPRLAARPLAGGIRPVDLARGGVVATSRRGRTTAVKVGRKVAQRLTAHGRPPSGTATALTHLRATWLAESPFADLHNVPFLRSDTLERLHEDPTSIDAATASFLLNLSVALDVLRHAAQRPTPPERLPDATDRGHHA